MQMKNVTENIHCPDCGDVIHPKRVDFLLKHGRRLTCIKCATEEKVVGFRTTDGKTTNELNIVKPYQGKELMEKDWRYRTAKRKKEK